MKKKILVVFGTRPEFIKMAPLIIHLKHQKSLDIDICNTGQHKEMLNQILSFFEIYPTFDLKVSEKARSLNEIVSTILNNLNSIMSDKKYDLVLVHGDTSSAMAASMAAFNLKIPIAHIEAGLRTYDISSPWPEEMNRRFISLVSSHNFAPTIMSKENLIKDGVNEKNIYVTGNTVIDSLFYVSDKIDKNSNSIQSFLLNKFSFLSDQKLILVTCHRRENWEIGFENICNALREIAHNKVQIVFPLHSNPNLQKIAQKILSNIKNIHLLEPQDYVSFVYLMKRSYLILSDSGGIQEEAPSLCKPVLLLRQETERPEVISTGAVKLVGTNPQKIVAAVDLLLKNKDAYERMSSTVNPYGLGNASELIVNQILKLYISDNEAGK